MPRGMLSPHGRALPVETARGVLSTAPEGRRPVSARAHDRCHDEAWRTMHGTRFAPCSAEVLRRGAAAVFPQHLPDRWLEALLEAADLVAPGAGDAEEGARGPECGAGLVGAVLVVLMAQRGHPDTLDVAISTLLSHLHCSLLALAAERVSRDTALGVDPPSLAHLCDAERAVRARRHAAGGASRVAGAKCERATATFVASQRGKTSMIVSGT